jgi:hypothetical protein
VEGVKSRRRARKGALAPKSFEGLRVVHRRLDVPHVGRSPLASPAIGEYG